MSPARTLCLAALLALVPLHAEAKPRPKRPAPTTPKPPPEPTTHEEPAPAPAPTPVAAPTPVPPPPAEVPGPCRKGPSGIPLDPLAPGFGDAGFASARRPCARTELTLTTHGRLAFEPSADRRAVLAGAALTGSFALRRELELFVTAELVQYQWAQTATLSAQSFALGPSSAGASYLFRDGAGLAAAATARVLLPTGTAETNVRTTGFALGVPVAYTLDPEAFLHGYAGLDLTFGLGAGPALPRPGGLLVVGGELHPLKAFALVGDLTIHLGNGALLDALTPSLAIRMRVAPRLWLEAAVAAQLIDPQGVTFWGDARLRTGGGVTLSYRP